MIKPLVTAYNHGAKSQPQGRWVSRDEFISLLFSHQKLQRCDDRDNNVRGLLNPDTGDQYLIKEVDLTS